MNDRLKELVSEYVKIKKEISHLSKIEKALKEQILKQLTNEKILKGLKDETVVIIKKLVPIYDPKILYDIIDKDKFFKIVKVSNVEASKIVDEMTLNQALKDIREITMLKVI